MLRYLSLFWSFDQTPHFVPGPRNLQIKHCLQEAETLILTIWCGRSPVYLEHSQIQMCFRALSGAEPEEIDALSAFSLISKRFSVFNHIKFGFRHLN